MAVFDQQQITQRYQDALDSFLDKVKQDPHVIAVILRGSLAYDKVWTKSDIDLLMVVRDQKLETTHYCIDEDNIVLNVDLVTRSGFRGALGKARGGDFDHSINVRSKVVYTTDDSITHYLAEMQQLGTDDIELTFFHHATDLIGTMEKIEKWLVVKNNPLYAQLYVLWSAPVLADMWLLLNHETPSRESVLRVMAADPDFISRFYERPMSGKMTEAEVYQTLEAMRQFLRENVELISRPVIRYMDDGQVKTVTMLVKQFGIRSHFIHHIFEFLNEMGIVEKVTETIRITPKGKKLVEEIGYIYTGNL